MRAFLMNALLFTKELELLIKLKNNNYGKLYRM